MKYCVMQRIEGYTFIDLYPHFINAEGMLDTMYSNDGLHLMGGGYLLETSDLSKGI